MEKKGYEGDYGRDIAIKKKTVIVLYETVSHRLRKAL